MLTVGVGRQRTDMCVDGGCRAGEDGHVCDVRCGAGEDGHVC